MKKTTGILAAVAALMMTVNSLSAAEGEPLKLLAIGNSYTGSLSPTLAQVAKQVGVKLDYCLMIVGGCTLAHHVELAEISADDPDFQPYSVIFSWGGVSCYQCVSDETAIPFCRSLQMVKRTSREGKAVVRWDGQIHKVLAGEKWDVVVIQQASTLSWKPASYEPAGSQLIDIIRRHAPQAKIMVQETWSPNELCGRLKHYGLTRDQHYERIHAAYAAFAAKHSLGIIPTGTAVQLYRAKKPVKEPMEDVIGMFVDTGRIPEPGYKTGDTYHSNEAGSFLQSCTWIATLFGSDLNGVKLPKTLAKKGYDLELIKSCALEAAKK